MTARARLEALMSLLFFMLDKLEMSRVFFRTVALADVIYMGKGGGIYYKVHLAALYEPREPCKGRARARVARIDACKHLKGVRCAMCNHTSPTLQKNRAKGHPDQARRVMIPSRDPSQEQAATRQFRNGALCTAALTGSGQQSRSAAATAN